MAEGRAPIVCTDEALKKMVDLCPRTLEDFLSISGIGQTFIDEYAEEFLDEIESYTEPAQNTIKMSDSDQHTLMELEKKLVNINRKNRLLFLSKISNKYAFDLFDVENNYNPLDIIFKKKTVKVCSLSQQSEVRWQSGEDRYKRIVGLLREINKDLRDKGQFNLYIGYPFVIGRLSGEKFDVRAPLVLFPAQIERYTNYIDVRLDTSRDIVYNNNLILAYHKFNNIRRSLPDTDIKEVREQEFIENTLDFYQKEELLIKIRNRGLSKFKNYMAGEFPSFEEGELYLEENVVIGKFPIYSSSIQKDFGDILEKGKINVILSDLLNGLNSFDEEYDGYSGDMPIENKDKPLGISEKELTYIGELNSSQENVLRAIKRKDTIVVQGPPGTGKSQTIASLIADFVGNGSNVLMVSEKKAALDVVYSRLGELNCYAMLIDDVNDKHSFYSQMERILDVNAETNDVSNEIEEKSEKIENTIIKLENIAQKLYEPNDFGIEPYKLYAVSKKYNFENANEKDEFRLFRSKIKDEILQMSYPALKAASATWDDRNLCIQANLYNEQIAAYPWLDSMQEDLHGYKLIQCMDMAQELSESIRKWNNRLSIIQFFTKSRIMNSIEKFVSTYMFSLTSSEKQDCLRHGFSKEALAQYPDFRDAKLSYNQIPQGQKDYFSVMVILRQILDCDFEAVNAKLFNVVINDYLFRFEDDNREILRDVNDFNKIIESLNGAIQQKRELTALYLKDKLSGYISDTKQCKRYGDIKRLVESKRKKSVNKFINTFRSELFEGIRIWLMTPEVSSEILPLCTGIYDLVIFDEASQMFIENAVPAIFRAKKVVIAGDSKQLRPSSLGSGRIEMDEEQGEDDENNAALEEKSLLDVARFRYMPPLTLNYHYRSKYEELIAFSNYAFYKGKLYVSPNVALPRTPPIEIHKIEGGQWINRSNLAEAKEIVCLLKEFFVNRTGVETIGIITFNSQQRDLIDDLIDEECAKDSEFCVKIKTEIDRKDRGEDVGLFVKNIENVQGDERDVIMFSIGYAKDEKGRLVHKFGWLNNEGGENRLNVAISRARSKIHIVTSFIPEELQVEDSRNDGPRYLKKYLEYCFAVSDNKTELAQQILLSFSDAENNNQDLRFDSDFENQVYDALIDRGFEVNTQVGIGGYSIDLAIKQNGKYVLGIECDGKLYHSSKSARERDFYRQKYLESRGWKIHRIWSPNWWKNPVFEIDKIEKLVTLNSKGCN